MYIRVYVCMYGYVQYVASYVISFNSSIGSSNSNLNISTSSPTRNTTWFNNGLNCSGNEVCLTSCLSSIPASPSNQCNNEVGVRCSKYTINSICSLEFIS